MARKWPWLDVPDELRDWLTKQAPGQLRGWFEANSQLYSQFDSPQQRQLGELLRRFSESPHEQGLRDLLRRLQEQFDADAPPSAAAGDLFATELSDTASFDASLVSVGQLTATEDEDSAEFVLERKRKKGAGAKPSLSQDQIDQGKAYCRRMLDKHPTWLERLGWKGAAMDCMVEVAVLKKLDPRSWQTVKRCILMPVAKERGLLPQSE